MLRERVTLLNQMWRFSCALNLVAILYLSGLTSLITLRICRTGSAHAFLETLSDLPSPPWSVLVLSVLSYGLLLLTFHCRRRTGRHERLFCIAEVSLCVFITLLLRLSYKGVVLLVIADLLVYAASWRKRGALMALMITVYVAADADLLHIITPMVTFENYVNFYPARHAALLVGIRNLLTSASVIAFVLFCAVLMRQRSAETVRIRRLNTQLALANAQLKQMAAERERMAQLHERNRLAREIHDTLGHALTGISVGLDASLALLDVSPEATRRQLMLVSDAARRGLEDVRASVSALRAEEDAPLPPLAQALQTLASDAAAASGAVIETHLALDGIELTADEHNTVLRLVQEGITNALRHGGASHIEVFAGPEPNGRALRLHVQDNGVGCPLIVPNFGLRHMRERLDLLGGWASFDGTNGFTIEAGIPLRKEEHT